MSSMEMQVVTSVMPFLHPTVAEVLLHIFPGEVCELQTTTPASGGSGRRSCSCTCSLRTGRCGTTAFCMRQNTEGCGGEILISAAYETFRFFEVRSC